MRLVSAFLSVKHLMSQRIHCETPNPSWSSIPFIFFSWHNVVTLDPEFLNERCIKSQEISKLVKRTGLKTIDDSLILLLLYEPVMITNDSRKKKTKVNQL